MHLSRLTTAYLSSRWARGVAALVPVAFVGWIMTWAQFTDIEVYRIGARVWLEGGDLYGELPASEANVQLPFTYPPLSAVLFSVLAFLPRPVAIVLFTATSVAALYVALVLVMRTLTRHPWRDVVWLAAALTGVVVLAEPMVATLRFGQINTMLMALVIIDVVLGRGRWWQGSLVGLALAIKLTPAVFLAYFLARRDWRALAMGIGSAALYTGLGFLAAPSESTQYWVETLRDPSRIGTLSYVANQSLTGVLVRFGVDESIRSVVWFSVCAVLGLGLLYLMHRLVQRGQDGPAWALMGVYALLASPVSWSHHWVWAIPALLITLSWARDSRPALVVGVAGVVIFFSYAMWAFPAEEHRELTWDLTGRLLGNGYVWWGLAFVAVAAVQALRSAPSKQ